MLEWAILLLFTLALFLCVLSGHSLVLALLFGYLLFFLHGLLRKKTAAALLRLSWRGIWQVKNVLIVYVLVGMLTALWRVCGTIPAIIEYSVGFIAPSAFLLVSFLLCALVSVLTGTALGSVATMGVICMTMGRGLGIDPVLLGGAILSGVRVGDRCSPMSSSALLVCEVTQTNIYENIKNMVRTAAVPFVLSCAVYWLLGRSQHPQAAVLTAGTLYRDHFILTPIVVLPAALVFLLALFRIDVKRTMLASICTAFFIALLVQGTALPELLKLLVLGFHPEDPGLAAALGGGGVVSMASVIAIVLISATYAGIFPETGLLSGLQRHLNALGRRITPYGALLFTAVLTGVITCGQSLTIILTRQLCSELVPSRARMASALEDTAVVIPALIPWSVAAVVPLAAISAPSRALLAACYIYLLPLCHFFGQRFVREAREAV